MKASLALLCLLPLVSSAAPLTAPQVLVCPGPLFPAKCAVPVFAPTSSPLTVASVSKTLPAWQHTFGGYAATALLVACPIGATVSADAKTCTNTGLDATVLLAKSAFTLPTQSVVITSVDNPQLIVTFTVLPVPACFTVGLEKVCVP